jgi:N-acetyl-anhydromuramyl-L-alanine amidase AmpD
MGFKQNRIGRSLLVAGLVLALVLLPRLGGAVDLNNGLGTLLSGPAFQQELPIPDGGLNPEDHLPKKRAMLPVPTNVPDAITSPRFVPRQMIVTVDESNYDPRTDVDLYGNPIQNDFIVVLHETVGSATSAINTFQRYNPNDNDQVSYHTLIARDGTVIYLVPPEMRAFGAGNSVFDGPNGSETVRLHPVLPPSVNNFSYHASLESPRDGRGNSRTHSGYTEAQYRSLAWLVAQTDIPDERITSHEAVDRSGSRMDPRSFDRQRFLSLLHSFRSERPA